MSTPKYNAVMLDLEFLDKAESAALMQIGIVPMNTETLTYEKDPSKCFFLHVDPDDCVQYGMTIGIDTLKWWIKQDLTVLQKAFNIDGKEFKNQPLEVSLAKVTGFIQNIGHPDLTVYQRGDKDAAILSFAYRKAFKKDPPWVWHNVADIRGITKAVGIDKPNNDKKHDALANALTQAEHLMLSLAKIRGVSLKTETKKQPVVENNDEDL